MVTNFDMFTLIKYLQCTEELSFTDLSILEDLFSGMNHFE